MDTNTTEQRNVNTTTTTTTTTGNSAATAAATLQSDICLNPSQNKIILALAIIAGLLFTICFKGSKITAGLSSILFFNGMSLGLYLTLKKLDLLVNKRAFILALPIFLLSAFNAYFEYSCYNTFNCVGFYVLFVIMTLKAVAPHSQKIKLEDFLSLMFNNCFQALPKALKQDISIDTLKLKRAAIGLCASLPFIYVIGMLFITGDDAFFWAFEDLCSFKFDVYSFIWGVIVFLAVGIYFCGYTFSVNYKIHSISFKSLKIDNIIAVCFLTPVNLLFLFFCISQLRYVEGGMTIPSFTTYARYVREGFFQLLFVTLINFAIILAFTEAIKDFGRKAVKMSLIILCGFTFLLILSSYYRMYLYISAYGYTPLRIQVLTFLTAETVLIFFTVFSIIKGKTEIISRFVFCGILSLFLLNFIARAEVSTYLNCNVLNFDYTYMPLSVYKHTDIPILIDKYNKTDDKEEKQAIRSQIRTVLYTDNAEETPWQSFSMQNYINDKLAEDFLNNTLSEK